jgi:hypothetical protein
MADSLSFPNVDTIRFDTYDDGTLEIEFHDNSNGWYSPGDISRYLTPEQTRQLKEFLIKNFP